MVEASGNDVMPEWSVAANIVHERPYGQLGIERRRGTTHFRPGARVWVIDWFPGMCSEVIVVGHHRGSRRLVKMVVSVKFVERWRPRLVYSPTVLAIIHAHFCDARRLVTTKEEAEEMCLALSAWREGMRPEPVHEPGQIIGPAPGDRLRVAPFKPGQAGVLDRSRQWDIPVALFPENLTGIGTVVLVDRDVDGQISIQPLGPSPGTPR